MSLKAMAGKVLVDRKTVEDAARWRWLSTHVDTLAAAGARPGDVTVYWRYTRSGALYQQPALNHPTKAAAITAAVDAARKGMP